MVNREEDWAVVTGASSGIGREFATIFADNNIPVLLAGRDKNALEEVAHSLRAKGVKTIIFCGDLSEEKTAKELYKLAKDKQMSVEYLVNNAGFGDYGLFMDGDWEKYQKMIGLNIASLTYLTKVFGQDMKKQRHGKILNVASTAAYLPGPLMAVYYATKAYVLRLSVALNQELKGSGVTVTALCPGPTTTNFARVANAQKSSIFASKNLPTAEMVARYGFAAMMAGRPVAVHGLRNKLVTHVSGILSPAFAAKLVHRIQS